MFNKLNLFSKTEMKVLRFILTHDTDSYGREIASGAKVSVGSANSILKKFTKNGLITPNKRGRMIFYRRNSADSRIMQYKRSHAVELIAALVEKIKPLSRRVILFGSCAEGKDTEESDIDLFVLSDEKEKIREILSENHKISSIILNSREYSVLEEKDKPLFERINKGVELWGGKP